MNIPVLAALFVRSDSVYKKLGFDCWDIERDARGFSGSVPVVAHPPCRSWGRLKHMAKPRPDEKELAVFAVGVVRSNGGVLEHPANSLLWAFCELPKPGEFPDEFGGYTLEIDQYDYGHPCRKKTWLYCCRVSVPKFPPKNTKIAIYSIAGCSANGGVKGTKSATRKVREHTPEALAVWIQNSLLSVRG